MDNRSVAWCVQYLRALDELSSSADEDAPVPTTRREYILLRDLLICMDVLREIHDDYTPTVQAIEVVAERVFVSYSSARRAYYAMKDDPLVHKLIVYRRPC
ncbi:hypothetical protein D3C76_650660 [compost metagenome]